uniref:Uncharacterized protein n=1 Tax=Arundo donax TaxID=35708 RepID=A0A0A9CPC3_ARUDO
MIYHIKHVTCNWKHKSSSPKLEYSSQNVATSGNNKDRRQ